MVRRLAAGLVVAALSLTLAVVGYARTTAIPKLQGTVGPGFTITLKRNGTPVKVLKAGRYTFVVTDKASFHGFMLRKVKGGTFQKLLSPVPFVGKKTVTVKLTAGRWKFFCPPHVSTMFGFFTVK